MIKKLLLFLFLTIQLFARNTTVNLDHIEIDGFLDSLKPKAAVMLCKDHAQTLDNYIGCLEKNAQDNPTVENINVLAGIYAVYQMYDKAITTYEINVAKGDKEATYYLAGIYNEVLQQHEKALPYFEMIKEYKDATCQIGGIKAIVKDESWFKFLDERKAKKRTFDFYDNEIKNGNIKAYGCKGLYYNKFEEYEDAEKVFLEGLKHGDEQNLFYLGNFYNYYDYKYNNKKAMEYYERSYEAGNDQAAHNLGFNYETSYEFEDAIKWYKLSVKRGDLKSLINLGNIYRVNNYGEKALEIYKKAGNLGSWYGNKSVWVYYSEAKRFDEGIEYLKDRFNHGYKECARFVGRIYDDDLKENEQAIKWYKKGYMAGDSRSAFNLAILFHVKLKEYEKAIEWYKKAAAMGSTKAMNNLAVLYEDDLKDKEKAIEWFKKASDKGDEKAKKELKKIGVLDE